MKKNRIKYILLLSCLALNSMAQDTLKNRFVFLVYPMNLFVGDVPIGIEYKISKKLSSETSVNIKCYEPQIFYKYNRGFKFQEIVKWSLINKKRFQFKVEALLCYRYFYFKNKEDSWLERFPNNDLGGNNFSFSMNRRFTTFGAGLGFGFYAQVSRFVNLSLSFHGEYYNYTRYYTVNKVIKGDISSYPDIVLPYNGHYSGNSWFPNILIRIGYEIH